MQKSHAVDASDDEMDDDENDANIKETVEEEEEPEIIESDIELDESDTVEPDNDEPQKVCHPTYLTFFLFWILKVHVYF